MVLRCTILLLLATFVARGQELYFPGAFNDWETVEPETLGWCESELTDLQDFLAERDTKSFLILKNGRIAIEWYYDSFTRDSVWYWASAGKSLTSTLVGIAQEEGLLSIDDPTSDYLGEGWTQLSPEQEGQITIRHQLTMTTGLNDIGVNVDCTDPECLTYLAEPGTRWAYHNAPYTLLGSVIEAASGQTLNQFYNTRIGTPIGAWGLYYPLDYNRVFFSRTRDMARFGLMTLANGQWNGTSVLGDQAYMEAMSTPSQELNPAYGYLWWLNGQESFQQPRLQLNFPGAIIPTAPADMFAGLGKNDQKVYVVPSQNMVVVRLGEDAGEGLLALSGFDDILWEKISALACTTSTDELSAGAQLRISPNPVTGVALLRSDQPIALLQLISITGQRWVLPVQEQLDLSAFPAGMYWVEAQLHDGESVIQKVVVQ